MSSLGEETMSDAILNVVFGSLELHVFRNRQYAAASYPAIGAATVQLDEELVCSNRTLSQKKFWSALDLFIKK